jgi:hypothetical protein
MGDRGCVVWKRGDRREKGGDRKINAIADFVVRSLDNQDSRYQISDRCLGWGSLARSPVMLENSEKECDRI